MLHRTPSSPVLRPSGRLRATRSRRARRIAGSATALAASAAALVGLAGQQSSHAASATPTLGPTARYGAVTIADTNFPIPTNALYVANGGSDSNPGSLAAPFASIHKALA